MVGETHQVFFPAASENIHFYTYFIRRRHFWPLRLSTVPSFIRTRGRVAFRRVRVWHEPQKRLFPTLGVWKACGGLNANVWKGKIAHLRPISVASGISKTREKAVWVNSRVEPLFFNTHSRVKRLQKPPWAFSVSLGSEHKRACWFSSLARGNAFAFHNLQMDGPKITLPHQPGWHSQQVNRGAINEVN